MAKRKLYRSYNRIFAGVCGGLADYFNVDPTLVRVLYVVLSVCSAAFPGLLVYILLMLIIPERPFPFDGNDSDNYEDAEIIE
jgi:phage shock protein C